MKFIPYAGYAEVEPLNADSIIASDDKKFIEAAKVISVRSDKLERNPDIDVGEIIFFRPHGCFETPEYEGKKHYVVRIDPEFILGKMSND